MKKQFRGKRLKQRREELGLTQAELAERVGAGQNQVYRYEKGESEPSVEMLAHLSVELSVSADWLLGLTDDPRPTVSEKDLEPNEMELINIYRRRDWREIVRFAVEQPVEDGK